MTFHPERVVVRFDQSIEVFVPVGYGEGPPSGMY